ncbi:DUF3558 family protein [Corynebacterium matruchotii]|uniref:DUF3558 domain-containing protein n=3 Tax=Corynebacterium matruchotii TaxID=43768 RepID=E0DDZ8_9CORY|nr:DUF3558 family protein [Corynebacterium matruchotii]EFM49522.1 hypothetical protein HMPREF0299_7671 [Corynebacterium matruchotii ATCC 14266]QIP44822.1 DUF3558 family protein [Corynebacterium matruchotii]SPW28190.1 Uncharacterised protein [Corynebacterium matruchotii]
MLFKFPRVFLAAASATSILALSGCVLPTSLPTSSVAEQAEASQSSAPAAENTQSAGAKSIANHTIGEVLEIGKYLPEQNGQEYFNPCRDFTKEQWASLGLEAKPYDPQTDSPVFMTPTLCQVKGTGNDVKGISITADSRGIKEALKDAKRQDDVNVKRPDYVYFYTEPKDEKNKCTAATVTNQGRVAVQVYEYRDDKTSSIEPICQQALDIMQKMFQLPAQAQVASAPPTTPTDPSAEPATPQPTPPPATSTAPEPPASTSNNVPTGQTLGEKLGVGKFRITDLPRKTFNACTEITREQWLSLDLKVEKEIKSSPINGLPEDQSRKTCQVRNNPGGEEPTEQFRVSADYTTYALQMSFDKLVVNVKVNKPDYIYLFEEKSNTAENICSAGAETNRGRMAVTANLQGSAGSKPTKEQACQRAVDRLLEISNLKAEALENPLHME